MILHDFCAMAGNGSVETRQRCVILEGQADIVQEEADVLLLLKSPQLLEPLGMHEMVQRWQRLHTIPDRREKFTFRPIALSTQKLSSTALKQIGVCQVILPAWMKDSGVPHFLMQLMI